MTSVKLTALFLALLLAVSLAACGNPIRDVVIGKDPVITPTPDPEPDPTPDPEPAETESARRARLGVRRKRQDRFDDGRADAAVHDARLERLSDRTVEDVEDMLRAGVVEFRPAVPHLVRLEEDPVHAPFGVTHDTLLKRSSRISFATASTSSAVTAAMPFTSSSGSRTRP